MEFIIDFIKRVQHKLNRNQMISSVIKLVTFGFVAGLIVILISLFVPFYYYLYVAVFFAIVSLVLGIISGIRNRESEEKAALYIDSFGFNEKISTAYENRDKNEGIYVMQRQDAEAHLRAKGDKVKVKISLPMVHLVLSIFLLIAGVILSFIPTKSRMISKEKHISRISAKEEEKKIEELEKSLSEIDHSKLTEEDLKELNSLMESLELSKKEFESVDSKEKLDKAKERYDYKLGDVTENLEKIADGKSEEIQYSIKTASEIAESQKKSENKQTANNNMGNENVPSQNGNENGESQNRNENGESQNGNENGESQNGNENGESQNGNENGESQNGNSGSGEGNEGSSSQNGNSGNGDNSGKGGSGSGQGNGSGEKKVDHNHDYVKVNENIKGKMGESSTNKYSKEQNGLAWEGKKVPYNSVIKDYSNAANEGIDRGKYPGNMTDVIKDYFSGLE